MSDSNAFETFPAVRAIVVEAVAQDQAVYQMLADVEAHARRHGSALTFHDAVEVARHHDRLLAEHQRRVVDAALGRRDVS